MLKMKKTVLQIACGVFICAGMHAEALTDGTWTAATDSDLTNGTNWTSNPTVPDGVATFPSTAASFTPFNSSGSTFSFEDFVFSSGSFNYDFLVDTGSGLQYTLNGMVNNTPNSLQTFDVPAGGLNFLNSSSADKTGTGLITYNFSGSSVCNFNNTTDAGAAEFNLVNILLGNFNFINSSTAKNSQFNMDNSSIDFTDSSKAGAAHFNVFNNSLIRFDDTSSASTAKINLGNGGVASFHGNSTAAQSEMLGIASFIDFNDSSTAGSAKFNLFQSSLDFRDTSTGGSQVDASLTNISNLSLNGNAQNIALGSLATDTSSRIFLKNNTLTVGALNKSTTIGAIINDSGLSGTFVKVGTGEIILSGVSPNPTLTGIVQAGELQLNGLFGGNMTVNGARFSGTGTVGNDLTINAGGTIAPGRSIGTLHVQGDYVQNANTFYEVEVNLAGQSDLIDVTGTATLNGGLVEVTALDGFAVTRYTIVNANAGLAGAFAGVVAINPNGDPALFTPVLSYDANHAYINIQAAIINAAETFNERQVAFQLDSIENPTPGQSLILSTIINLPIEEAREALNQMSGVQHANDLFAVEVINRQFIRRLYDPIRYLVTTQPCNNDYSSYDCCNPCDSSGNGNFWFEAGAGRLNQRGDCNARGFKLSGYEISLGAQKTMCNDWTFGVAGSYENDHIHYNQGGSGKLNTWLGGIYGLYRPSCYYVLADLAYGYTNNKMRRSIEFGSLAFTAHSKPKISQLTFYAEAGMDFSLCSALIQPFIGIEVDSYWQRRVTEHGAEDLNLIINKKERTNTLSRLGVHLTSEDQCDFNVSIDLAWLYRFSKRNNEISERFDTFGSDFTIRGVDVPRNSGEAAVTFSTKICNNWRAYVEASGEFWKHSSAYNVLGGIETSW